MRNLNERIQRNFRNNIAISNLREEWIMKKNTKKKVLITTMVIIGTLSFPIAIIVSFFKTFPGSNKTLSLLNTGK